MKIILLILLLLSLFLYTIPCLANTSFELAYGVVPAKESGMQQGDSWRLSYGHKLTRFDEFLQQYNLNLRLEASMQRWQDINNRHNHVVSINPIFQYLWDSQPISIFIEFGIGAAYFENSHYLDRNLGSHWLFEDKFAIGVVLSNKHRIGLFIMHYSNADLASHNDGADSIGLSYGYIW